MKNLKLVLLLIILVISCKMVGQDEIQNNTIKDTKITASQQLYIDLYRNENVPLYVINGVANEHNIKLLNQIDPKDVLEIKPLKDADALKIYGDKAKNGVVEFTLKQKNKYSLKKLNKFYSLQDTKHINEEKITISGIIYDSTNTPIPTAVISNLNIKEAYYSDLEGKYSIKAYKKDNLVYFKEGYESKKIIAKEETKINIVLNKVSASNEPRMIKKPVIYLYPTQKTDLNISLDFKGKMLTTFPKYDENWTVTAYPDGRIFDKKTNRFYTSLFWDGAQNFPKEHYQYQSGFVVSKNDLTNFLIEKLDFMGLNNFETNDFVQYWLPILEKNETNFIHFYVNSDYDVISKNNVFPKPDTSIRIFMEFYGLDKPIEILKQDLPKTERKGFTLIEWGGSDVSELINELKNLKL
ncbi:MAG TPA: hypothetical protein VIV55_13025 [Flavobacterium sp.]